MLLSVPSDVKGEGHVSTLSTPRVPSAAVELMIQHPVSELIQRRAVWFPSPRRQSKEPFLTDLRVAHERNVFPLYFDSLPTSDQATAIDAVKIGIPVSVTAPPKGVLDKWKRSLLKITRLQREDARAALFDRPEAFSPYEDDEKALQVELHLFEFTEIDRKVIRPVLLVR
jgi:hypothetical protein